MRRFIVPVTDWTGQQVLLADDVVRHLSTVLRMQVDDELELLDGHGRCAHCRLATLDKKKGCAEILRQWNEPETAVPVQLLQAVPKGEKMDWLLQKVTELGLHRLTPVHTERSIPNLKGERATKRLERWRKIGLEAARQSRRAWLPQIEAVQSFETALAATTADLKLLLWEDERQPLKAVLPEQSPGSIAVVVGPEGGLTAREAEYATEQGFVPVRLGPRILRTETAGVAILSILQYVYGDLAQGEPKPL